MPSKSAYPAQMKSRLFFYQRLFCKEGKWDSEYTKEGGEDGRVQSPPHPPLENGDTSFHLTCIYQVSSHSPPPFLSSIPFWALTQSCAPNPNSICIAERTHQISGQHSVGATAGFPCQSFQCLHCGRSVAGFLHLNTVCAEVEIHHRSIRRR